MKKIIFLTLIIGMMIATTAQAQFVQVHNNLVAGTAVNATGSPLCNGATANLTCTPATGGDVVGGYTYQWQFSPDNITFTDIVGATLLNYTTPALPDTTYYKVKVTNSCGIVTSNVIQINVYDSFVFVGGVAAISGGLPIICYNTSPGTLTAPIVTGGAPGTIAQWQSSPDNITWTNVIGANGPTHTPGNLLANNYYRVIFTNVCGILTSTVKTITVYNDFVFVGGIATISGGTSPICYNTLPGTLTAPIVIGGAPGTSAQWQSSPDNLIWSNIVGANGQTHTPGHLTANTYYRVVFTNVCGVLTSAVTTINVYNDFIFAGITTISGGASPICYNTLPGILTAPTVTGGAPGTTSQWQSSPDNIIWTNIGVLNSPTYTPGNLLGDTYYRVVFTNFCNVLTSSIKTINVWAPFNPGVVTFATVNNDTTIICYNTAPNQIINLVSPSGGDGIYTYNWVQSTTNVAPWSPAIGGTNSQSYQPPVLLNQMGYRRNVTNTCGVGHSTAQ